MADAKRLAPHCPRCGSDNVQRDACARWDVATQRWELITVYDDATCAACGEESKSLDWVDIESTPTRADALQALDPCTIDIPLADVDPADLRGFPKP